MALNPQRFVAFRNGNCVQCGFCGQYVDCSSKTDGCIGCGACVVACPQAARGLRPISTDKSADCSEHKNLIDFAVDGEPQQLLGPISVSTALEHLGLGSETDGSERKSPKAACRTGGCWNCAVLINNVLTRSCITPLRSGMQIVTNPQVVGQATPKRVVTLMRPAPHRNPSIFTHGCNYRCDLCHNWDLTFSSTACALTPAQTVDQLGLRPEKDRWIGISGGEPTLYRKWLVATVRQLRQAAPESRIQLDTNASVLTPDYIDELIAAGVTDVSPDLKALRIETFMKISGVRNKEDAQQYMQTVWQAIGHLHANYADKVFMAVSIPCHPRIHSKSELEEMAAALAALSPEIPVTLTELQPAFRNRDWPLLHRQAMEEALEFLSGAGLKRVMIQGGAGIPQAVDPCDLALSTEEF